MNIFEIIAAVGARLGDTASKRVPFQHLALDTDGVWFWAERADVIFHTEIEKGEDLKLPTAERRYTAIVLWLPKDIVDEVIK